jgi:hypothetical protein
VHEAFDVVEVAVDAAFNDAFESLVKLCASGFDKDAKWESAAFFHVFDVGSEDGYFSVFDFVEGFDFCEFKFFFNGWSAKFDLHVVPADSLSFVDYTYVDRDIFKH